MPALEEVLFFHNPWWTEGEVPARLKLKYRRPLLEKLLSYLPLDRIIVVKGPRRVGKTTLMYQFIDSLIQKGVAPENILYLSFDDIQLRKDLDTIIKNYEKIFKRMILEGGEVYFFLDEVTFLDDWQFQVKKYFDKKYPIKFILSGSSSLFIRKGAESLAGRTVEEILLPFSFFEFSEYKMDDDKLKRVLEELRKEFSYSSFPDVAMLAPYQPKLAILFDEYLRKGGFPHILEVEEESIWQRLLREDVLEKVIYRDLVELYDIKKPYVLERLFLYLVGNTCGLLKISNVANSLDLSREYTEKYIEYLRSTYLVLKWRKYAFSVEKQVRALEKVGLVDSGFLSAFKVFDESKAVETMVGRHLESKAPCYWRNKHEVDFIVMRGNVPVPIEVKYRDKIEKRSLKGILEFMSKFDVESGIVLTRDRQGKEKIDDKSLIFIPSWLFLLLAS